MLVRPWNADLNLHTDQLTSLPIWVQLHGLNVKYWGIDSLGKIGSILGIPIKTDRYTMEKRYLQYARLLIDIPLDMEFPDYVEFVNEHDILIRVDIHYEWKPLKCAHCHMYGHLENECRKKDPASTKQVWRPKTKAPRQDEEGFIMVQTRRTPSRPVSPKPAGPANDITTSNTFTALEDQEVNTEPPASLTEGLPPDGHHK